MVERYRGKNFGTVKRLRQRSLGVRHRVYATWDPQRFGTILIDGPEVSEVKWDDGTIRYVSNDHLRHAPMNAAKRPS